MTEDSYNSFDELKRCESAETDYRITIEDVGSDVTVIAPHGGKIEPRTSEIARGIARGTYNCYCFEGIKEAGNRCLHITSHKFDEPGALRLVSRSAFVVAVHACTGTAGKVHIGGRDQVLIAAIAEELAERGIAVTRKYPRFKGSHPRNICNRGAARQGAQLEITRDLRDDPEKIHLISEAVHAALARMI